MRVTVRSCGRAIQVEAADVVVGDVLVLGSGPADREAAPAVWCGRRLAAHRGERRRSTSSWGNLLAGTFLVEGAWPTPWSLAIGEATRLAAIARLTTLTHRPATPLAKELHRGDDRRHRPGRGWGSSGRSTCSEPASEGLVFAIGVTVALVPEALLPTVTRPSRGVRSRWPSGR